MIRRALLVTVVLGLAGALPAAAPDVTASLRVSSSGFGPGTVRARQGDVVRFVVTSADDDHCFALDDFRVEKRIGAGRTVTVDVTTADAGSFAYHCCLHEEKGRLIVSE